MSCTWTVCTPFPNEPVLKTSAAVRGALLMGRTATAACILLSKSNSVYPSFPPSATITSSAISATSSKVLPAP